MMLFFTTCFIHELPQMASLSGVFGKIVVGVVDRKTDTIPAITDTELLFLDTIGLEDLDELSAKYTTDELRAVAKVLFGHYLYTRLAVNDYLAHITPAFYPAMELFGTNNIYLLPKTTQPYEIKDEKTILNSGMYESSFWAVRQSESATRFLAWWNEKIKQQGYINRCEGLNADELWLNHVPIFFENVKIVRDPLLIKKHKIKFKKNNTKPSSLGIYIPKKPLMWLRKPLATGLRALSNGIDNVLKLYQQARSDG
jgi:hypothetical protein